MVISVKDGIKLVGISIVFFCAVFVCTFFMNYYLDALEIGERVDESLKSLYEAQLATARLTCAVTGGVLAFISAIMLVFYIGLFVDANRKRLGILKAMGYSEGKIAVKFWVFGLSVFVGTALGYGLGHAAMPFIYREMSIDGLPHIVVNFHVELLFAFVFAPTALFSALACAFARLALRKNLTAILKGGQAEKKRQKSNAGASGENKPFLIQMCFGVLRSKKSIVFFVTFACFCFSSMVQMGLSMRDLSSVTMGMMILVIGLVIAVTAFIMAITTVIHSNIKNIALMKAFGYSQKERVAALLLGYVPFACLGFVLGTVYQYGFLLLMINVVFKKVESVPKYNFDMLAFFIAFGAFIVAYAFAMIYYALRIGRISVKAAMSEE
ncbi:MAG: ABC transporter permease [Clostridiales bacterium]|nr:ABC transporter permease [Clostridiales bacterium]